MMIEAYLPRAGCPYYYATLWLDDDKKEAVCQLIAWIRMVERIAFDVSDSGVAMTKLAYWKNEVSTCFAGQQPSHPDSQLLKNIIEKYLLPVESFEEIFDAIIMLVESPHFLEQKQLSLYMLRRFGHMCAMISHITEPLTPKRYKLALEVGESIGWKEVFLSIEQYYQQGKSIIPSEWFIRTGLYEKNFFSPKDGIRPEFFQQILTLVPNKKISDSALGHLDGPVLTSINRIYTASLAKKSPALISALRQLWLAFSCHLFWK